MRDVLALPGGNDLEQIVARRIRMVLEHVPKSRSCVRGVIPFLLEKIASLAAQGAQARPHEDGAARMRPVLATGLMKGFHGIKARLREDLRKSKLEAIVGEQFADEFTLQNHIARLHVNLIEVAQWPRPVLHNVGNSVDGPP